MEEITMEKLLNDIDAVIKEFNKLIEAKDVQGLRTALGQIENLLQEETGIELDDREDPQYDHVLHELLARIGGKVELLDRTRGVNKTSGARYYTNEEIEGLIADQERALEEQDARIKELEENENNDNEENLSYAYSQRDEIARRIAELRAAIVEGAVFSSLTYIDPNLKALQDERASLVAEKMDILRQINELRGLEGSDGIDNSDIAKRIAELEEIIAQAENEIEGIKSRKISDVIAEKEAQLGDDETSVEELDAQIKAAEERMKQAAKDMKASRESGDDSTYAISRSNYSNAVQEISDLNARKALRSDIDFLRELDVNSQPAQVSTEEIDARIADAQRRLRETADARARANEEGNYELEAQYRSDYSAIVAEISDLEAEKAQLTQPSTEEIDNKIADAQRRLRETADARARANEEGNYELEAQYRSDYSAIVAEISDLQAQKDQLVSGLTIGEAIERLEKEIADLGAVDHSKEIEEIDAKIEEVNLRIDRNRLQLEEIENSEVSSLINDNLSEEDRSFLEDVIARFGSQSAQVSTEEIDNKIADAQRRLRETADARARANEEGNYGLEAQYRSDYSAIVAEISDLEAEKAQLTQPSTEEIDNKIADAQRRLKETADARARANEEGNYELEAQYRSDYSAIVAEISDLQSQKDGLAPKLTIKEAIERIEKEANPERAALEAKRNELATRKKEIQTAKRRATNIINSYKKAELAGKTYKNKSGISLEDAKAKKEETVEELKTINAQLKEIDVQLKALPEDRSYQEQIARLKQLAGMDVIEQQITADQQELSGLEAQKSELENDSNAEVGKEQKEKLARLKAITGIALLEKRIEDAQTEKDSLGDSERGEGQPDNSEKLNDLNHRRNEIINRIGEIDREIAGIPGIIPTETTTEKTVIDGLDITAEVDRIGDKVFKTHEIRMELAERGLTREDFLAYYKKAELETRDMIALLKEQQEALRRQARYVSFGENGEFYMNELDEAIQGSDEEKAIKVAEEMRKKYLETGAMEPEDAFYDKEITSLDEAKEMLVYATAAANQYEARDEAIDHEISEQKENGRIFVAEQRKIEDEIKSIQLATEELEGIDSLAEKELALRERQLRASINGGDPELEAEYQERLERFLAHKSSKKYSYRDKDGELQSCDMEFIDIDNYPEYAEDAMFLDLKDYDSALRMTSIYRDSGEDPYALGFGPQIDALEAQQEGLGIAELEKIIADKQHYMDSYNGQTNEHKVKYETLKTAGSYLKGMTPVEKSDPVIAKTRTVVGNAFRFLGLRMPKFTARDANGQEYRDAKTVLAGIGTAAVDAAIVAGITISTAVAGPALALSAYAAKGIVIGANKIAAAVEYNRHKEEIDSNLPTINNPSKDAQEVARKAKYREDGMGRLGAWFKAKTDRLPFQYFRDRKEATHERIVQDKLAEQREIVEAGIADARAIAEANLEVAKENQAIREANQRKAALSAKTYNEIIANPDSVNVERAHAVIAANAILEANGRDGDKSVNQGVTPSKQYVKDEEKYEKTGDVLHIEDINVDVDSKAITEEQAYTGEKQKVDRRNRVATAILAMGIKTGVSMIKNQLSTTEVVQEAQPDVPEQGHYESTTEQKWIEGYDEATGSHYEVGDGALKDSVTANGVNDVYQYRPTATVAAQDNVSGMAISVTGPDGKQIVASVAERSSNLAGKAANGGYKYVHNLVDTELDNISNPTDILDVFREGDPTYFQRVVETAGLSGKSDSEIMAYFIENGNFSIQSNRMEGWRTLLADNLREVTDYTHIDGHYEDVIGPDVWVVDQEAIPGVPEVTRTILDKVALGKSLRDGLLAGAALSGVDAIQEALQTTYIDGNIPGDAFDRAPAARMRDKDVREYLLGLEEEYREQNEQDFEDKDNHDDHDDHDEK